MKVGKAIETVRKMKEISQKELASKADITQSYLSLIESDKKDPNLKTLKEISLALDVPLPFILIYSLEKDDVPADKQNTFSVIMPIVNSLFSEYIKL